MITIVLLDDETICSSDVTLYFDVCHTKKNKNKKKERERRK